ncbi:MAG: GtrA family protein [Proteobacteria bacterium]|uniref:GtrA family protein n=1 Tax=Rudaea sp. TaxID=2136325 RepID=UPI001DE946C7|nr:GtrA family protein [Pseudomonadota bacterium]
MKRIGGNSDDTPQPRESRRFLHFLAAGGMAATANFCSRILFSQWLTFVPAVVLAYLVGLTTAFVLFRHFVFARSDKSLPRQMFWFVIVNVVALLQTVLISLLLVDWALPRLHVVRHAYEIAHACGIAAPVFTSYLGHKWLSFSSRQRGDEHDRGAGSADS